MKHFCPNDISALSLKKKKNILTDITFYELHLQTEFQKKLEVISFLTNFDEDGTVTTLTIWKGKIII